MQLRDNESHKLYTDDRTENNTLSQPSEGAAEHSRRITPLLQPGRHRAPSKTVITSTVKYGGNHTYCAGSSAPGKVDA